MKEYIKVSTGDTLIMISKKNGNITTRNIIIDILDFTEQKKKLIRGFLKHYEDLPIMFDSIEDLRFIRRVGIRI